MSYDWHVAHSLRALALALTSPRRGNPEDAITQIADLFREARLVSVATPTNFPSALSGTDLVGDEEGLATLRHVISEAPAEVRDIIDLLVTDLTTQFPETVNSVTVPVLFAGDDTYQQAQVIPGSGVTGRLTLARLASGPPGLHPNPQNMCFMRADDEFVQALSHAWQATARLNDACIVWTLRVSTAAAQPVSDVRGGSLGGAIAVALGDLTSGRVQKFFRLRGSDPRCAVSASIADTHGALAGVLGLDQKVAAASAAGLRLIVAADDVTYAQQTPHGQSLHIRGAATIGEAVLGARGRLNRRFHMLVVAALALVLSVVGTLYVYDLNQASQRQRDLAVSRQLVSESLVMGALDPTASRIKALAAWRLNPSTERRFAISSAESLPALAVIQTHAEQLYALAFSPDGRLIATGSGDNTVRFWDVATRSQVGEPLTGHTGPVTSVAFSPDSKLVASGSGDRTIRLWSVGDRRQIGMPLIGHSNAVRSVAFNRRDSILASSGEDQTLRLWDLASHQQVGTSFTGHTGIVYSVSFSPDGRTLASAGQDKTIRLWDVVSHRQRGKPFASEDSIVYAVTFSPDGNTLASASSDGTAKLWRISTRRQVFRSGGLINSTSGVAFNEDGSMIASGGLNKHSIQLTGLATGLEVGEPLIGHSESVWPIAFSPDGRILASGSLDGSMRLWSLASYGEFMRPLIAHTELVRSITLSPDGKTIVSGDANGVHLWDLTSRREIGPLSPNYQDTVYSVEYSPDGATVVTGDSGGKLRLWDVARRYQLGRPFAGHTDAVLSVAFSPDGGLLASGGVDGDVRLWNVADHQQFGRALAGHTGLVRSVAFSPDGRSVASAGDDKTIRLWDVTSHRQIGTTLQGHTSSVSSLAFNPDGKLLVSGSSDGTVRLWDLNDPSLVHPPLIDSLDPINSVSFSGGGQTLAVETDDSIALWDLGTRQQIGPPLTGALSLSSQMAVGNESQMVVRAAEDGALRLWDVSATIDPVAHICRSIGRTVTPEEWERLIPSGPAFRHLC